MRAAAASMKVLRSGGHWRIAVPDAYFPKYLPVFSSISLAHIFPSISSIILKYFQLILKYYSAKVISQIFPKYYLMCEYLKLKTTII